MFDLFHQPPLPVLESASPINQVHLSGQNMRLLNHLLSGQKINCFSDARRELKIGYLNSRCSDLRNVHHIDVKDKMIKVDYVSVKEYWMEEEEIKRVKNIYQLKTN